MSSCLCLYRPLWVRSEEPPAEKWMITFSLPLALEGFLEAVVIISTPQMIRAKSSRVSQVSGVCGLSRRPSCEISHQEGQCG